ncbi:hypothetical protein [Allorhodopirellula solitaria]
MIPTQRSRLAWTAFAILLMTSSLQAGSPWYVPWEGPWPWSRFEGSRRIDVIGPIGNRLPPSYRRQYNRPSYIGGKIAAKIAPSSQEAMAFHRSNELGLYDDNGIKGAFAGKHCPPERVEQHYFYPKPWEVLLVGPRDDRMQTSQTDEEFSPPEIYQEFEPREFRELLEESNALDDAIELEAPFGELEPLDESPEDALDGLALPESEQPEMTLPELTLPDGQ